MSALPFLAPHLRRSSRALLVAACLATATQAPAQSSGFREGDLFLSAASIQAPGYNGSGIVRVDPVTGESALLVKTVQTLDLVGSAVFDPYRQRLVLTAFIAGFTPTPLMEIWLVDAQGKLQNISPGGPHSGNHQRFAYAPTPSGRIYCTEGYGAAKPFSYIDAANQWHTLFASDGVTPMKIDGTEYYSNDGMIYDEVSNSLLVASITPAPGFPTFAVNVRKLPLSADGTRVVGPVGNATFEISDNPPGQSSGELPRGWSRGPNGKFLLCVHSIDDGSMPRMLEVDPTNLAIGIWGYNGSNPPNSWTTVTGGAYTPALGKMVVVDYFNNKLRAYAKADAGNGAVITPSPVTFTTPYYCSVTVVPDDGCDGSGSEYGNGLAGSGGFAPRLSSLGCPEIASSFSVRVDSALGGSFGQLLIAPAPAALPLFGGTLLVAPAALVVPVQLQGALGQPGAGTLQLPVLVNDPALVGASVFLQAGFFDPGAPEWVSLSNGLELTIG